MIRSVKQHSPSGDSSVGNVRFSMGDSMKKLMIGCLAGVLAAGGAGHAAVLDFVAEAAGDERGVADGTVIVMDGLAVTFSAGPAGSSFAYFDDLFDGRPAGLGVCETLAGPPPALCANTGDDNIRAGESVKLTFPAPMNLSDFSFSNRDHFSLNASTKTLLLNGVSFTFADVVSLTAAVVAVVTGVTSIEFAFGGSDPVEFYVNGFTAVPLPAAAPLLLAGLAGLSFASRRRKVQ